MQAFLETVIRGMVQQPEGVAIVALDRKGETVYELRVHPSDVGRLVGRRGNTINAIRTLLTAGAARKGGALLPGVDGRAGSGRRGPILTILTGRAGGRRVRRALRWDLGGMA